MGAPYNATADLLERNLKSPARVAFREAGPAAAPEVGVLFFRHRRWLRASLSARGIIGSKSWADVGVQVLF